MFIDKNSFKINGVSFGQYITEIEYSYPKLWGKDTGRSLAGTYGGTLIGIFPKFIVSFRRLTKAELEFVAPFLDIDAQTITYYDPVLKRENSILTYTGDWSVINNKTIYGDRKNDGFKISFIAREKRR